MIDTPRASILLVDDRPENLVALEATLAPLDCELVTATSGAEALRHLLDGDFAVILLDVQMPELDGFETARYIKQRERTRDIPI
ncbi:MAG TPA: response regulator, partial [Solirubrobacter sp.]|nr:response regulator [Solirubrobacter sp.]